MPFALPCPSRPTLTLVLACAIMASGPAVAQSSPGGFQLPSPTPTPTPAPQGPVDERAGVPIAPRIIPEQRSAPQPTPTPTPTATAAPPPTASETPTGSQSTPPPAASATQASPSERQATTTTQPERRAQENRQDQPPSRASEPSTGSNEPSATPANDNSTQSAPLGSSERTIGPDDWYDVDQLGTESEGNGAASSFGDATGENPAGSAWDDAQEAFTQSRYLAFAAVMAILLLGAGLFVWRRRKLSQQALALPAPALAAGVRKSLAATQGQADAAEAPPPPPPAEPLEVDLSLEIVTASRSVMMFMLEYRLTIANRSDKAARDIELTAQLTCAQRGGANAPPVAGGQPLETIERIGPHQSRSVSGQFRMPLTEIQAIRQGQNPIFIPLLHVSLVSAGEQTLTRSFVVGEPSTASQGRVHPIRLDTPPGGIPGLRAREVSLETA